MSISGSWEEGKVEFAGRMEKWKFSERLDPKSDWRKDRDLENCESVYSDPIQGASLYVVNPCTLPPFTVIFFVIF
jgi:hypothetical protein